jgi:hypothetical protein
MLTHPPTLTVYEELSAMPIYTLYVKTHKTTGLKYLGQTTKKIHIHILVLENFGKDISKNMDMTMIPKSFMNVKLSKK